MVVFPTCHCRKYFGSSRRIENIAFTKMFCIYIRFRQAFPFFPIRYSGLMLTLGKRCVAKTKKRLKFWFISVNHRIKSSKLIENFFKSCHHLDTGNLFEMFKTKENLQMENSLEKRNCPFFFIFIYCSCSVKVVNIFFRYIPSTKHIVIGDKET